MRINHVNNYQNNPYSPSFGVNLQSKKLRFKNDDFFVKLRGYGTNSDWAKKIIETADAAVNFIRERCNFEKTLNKICDGVTDANQIPLDIEKRRHTGILRVQREGWKHGSSWDGYALITRYNKANRYKTYADRFDYIVKNPLKNPFKGIMLTRPKHDKDTGKILSHADARYINNAFEHINKIYDDLYQKYILNEIKSDDLNDINDSIAEIRWVLAHATPWERGSDAISNTFIRAIYKAAGIKTFPLKRGISLDLEAYCTNLEEYKKNFPKYFQHEPKIAD